jgi:hypothetical protein
VLAIPHESALAHHLPREERMTQTTDDRIFYGPHPCARCGKTIVKASYEQGGEEFDYPDGPIYPNTEWHRHCCTVAEADRIYTAPT